MPISPCRDAFLIVLALLASTLAGRQAAAQGCGEGTSCVQPGPAPGCEDAECCSQVCALEPLCCEVSWDAACVILANEVCVGLCGAAASGPCGQPNGSPGCSDEACCTKVCAADAFCCDVDWDFNCVALASFSCQGGEPGTCGDPDAGPCDQPHPTGACSDATCCEVVCGFDPSCCDQSWDLLCVLLAEKICVKGCSLDCSGSAAVEAETCGKQTNDACFGKGQLAEMIDCGTEVCGSLFSDPDDGFDVDAYQLAIPDLGGLSTRIDLVFSSQTAAFVAVVKSSCADISDPLASLASDLCAPVFGGLCLPPGDYLLVVAPGAIDSIGGEPVACGMADYRLSVTCPTACDSGCGTAETPCDQPHDGPGCADADCCEVVCDLDPVCCTQAWDQLCVAVALDACGFELPLNDLCDDAIELVEGTVEFSSLGATTDGPGLPESCDEGFGPSMEADVWFSYESDCTGQLRIDTCGDFGFDSRLAVYRGSCGALDLVACDDNSPGCSPSGSSRVLFDALCGERYLVRVGGFKGASGVGQLTIACLSDPCPSPCTADLDGDGLVGGADLASLLAAWGTSGPTGDLDGDGTVSGADLTALLAAWGACP